jgi:hypothetical protein
MLAIAGIHDSNRDTVYPSNLGTKENIEMTHSQTGSDSQAKPMDTKTHSILRRVVAALAVIVPLPMFVAFSFSPPPPLLAQKTESEVGKIGLTSNESAANGPLPGDLTLYAQEFACQEKLKTGF